MICVFEICLESKDQSRFVSFRKKFDLPFEVREGMMVSAGCIGGLFVESPLRIELNDQQIVASLDQGYQLSESQVVEISQSLIQEGWAIETEENIEGLPGIEEAVSDWEKQA